MASSTVIGPAFGDLVQPFQIENLELRGRLVRLSPALDAILTPHAYPPEVAGILAETVTLAAALSSGLKFDGVFTLQTQSDGPVGLMVADITSEGDMRGYARYDEERLGKITADASSAGAIGPVPRLLGAGHLAFTVDQGPDTERYQGITELTGATMTDCAHTYFRQSEQLDTAIMLSSTLGDAGGDGAGLRAAALLLQRLPTSAGQGADMVDVSDDDWRHAVVMMSSLTSEELLDPALSPSQVLYRLFHEDGVRVYQERAFRAKCRCSRIRVMTTLKSFPKDEIRSLRAEDGKVIVTCEFCKAEYVFDEAALDALYLDDASAKRA